MKSEKIKGKRKAVVNRKTDIINTDIHVLRDKVQAFVCEEGGEKEGW